MKAPAFALAACTFLTGCSGLMDAMNRDPVDSERIVATVEPGTEPGTDGIVATSIATDPTRRLVVFNAYPGRLTAEMRVFICSEPPPDAAQEVLTTTTAALTAIAGNATTPEELQAGAKLTNSMETLIRALSTRTELVEVYRTATSALCELHMNGGMSDTEAAATFKEITLAAIAGATSVIAETDDRTLRDVEIPDAKPDAPPVAQGEAAQVNVEPADGNGERADGS